MTGMVLNLATIRKARRTTRTAPPARIVPNLAAVILTSPKAMAGPVPYFATVIQASEIASARVVADAAGEAFAGVVTGARAFAHERLLGRDCRRLGGEAVSGSCEQAESQKQNRD
jgi:hypothetical protein